MAGIGHSDVGQTVHLIAKDGLLNQTFLTPTERPHICDFSKMGIKPNHYKFKRLRLM